MQNTLEVRQSKSPRISIRMKVSGKSLNISWCQKNKVREHCFRNCNSLFEMLYNERENARVEISQCLLQCWDTVNLSASGASGLTPISFPGRNCWFPALISGRVGFSFSPPGIMATRTSIFWAVILVGAQLVVIGELIAIRVTPLARQYTGWSAYAAMLTMIAIPFLLTASPFFWRSHRRLAVSGLCVAAGAIIFTVSSW